MANEKRLIDANVLIEDLEAAEANAGMGAVVARTLILYVKRCATVDAVEVVRGRWMIAGRGIRACSECNHGIREHMACVNHYCPNCGAKMDGGVKNE